MKGMDVIFILQCMKLYGDGDDSARHAVCRARCCKSLNTIGGIR